MLRCEAFQRATQAVRAGSGGAGSGDGSSGDGGNGGGGRDSAAQAGSEGGRGGSKCAAAGQGARQPRDASAGPAALLAAALGAPAPPAAFEHQMPEPALAQAPAAWLQPASGTAPVASPAACMEAARLGSIAATQGAAVAAVAAALAPPPFAFWPQAPAGQAVPLASYQQLLYSLVPGAGGALPGLQPLMHPPAACNPSLPLPLAPLRLLQQPAGSQAAAGRSEAPRACSGPSAVTAAGPAFAHNEEEQPFTPSAFLREEAPTPIPSNFATPVSQAAPSPAASPAPALDLPNPVAVAPAAPDASPMHPTEGPSASLHKQGAPTVRLLPSAALSAMQSTHAAARVALHAAI